MAKLARVVSAMVVAGFALGVLPVAEGQSLADLARQEAERRKAADKAKKTYTNDDLKGGRPLTTGSSGKPAPEAGKEQAGKGEPAADAGSGKTDEAVAKRLAGLKEEMSELERQRDEAQRRVDELNSKVVDTFDQAAREKMIQDRDAAIADFRRLEVDIAAQGKVIGETEAAATARKPPPPQ